MSSDDGWRRACAAADLAEGDMMAVDIGGRALALYHVGTGFYATDRMCTHGRAALTDGVLDGHRIECPLHGGAFDIRSGAGQGSPIVRALRTYPVAVRDGDILIDIESGAARS